jgi:tRNA 2-thiouridine synthesizing protein B
MALILIKHGAHHSAEKTKLECAREDDSVVLIQDGVFWAAITDEIKNLKANVYVLQDDLCARGYPVEAAADANATMINYSELVDIIAKEEQTIT